MEKDERDTDSLERMLLDKIAWQMRNFFTDNDNKYMMDLSKPKIDIKKNVKMHIQTHIHTHTYTHIHTHIHTHTRKI